MVPALIALEQLRGEKLGDRLPCQIVGDLTLAKQGCCFFIPTKNKTSNSYQRVFVFINSAKKFVDNAEAALLDFRWRMEGRV